MLSEMQQRMVALFEQHVGAKVECDLDTTMATISDAPTMAGDVGRNGVSAYYRYHLEGLPVAGAGLLRRDGVLSQLRLYASRS